MENLIEKNFEGLTSAFDTSFEMQDKDVQNLVNETEKQVSLIEEKKNELVSNKKELSLKHQSFLEEELLKLIINTNSMLTKLQSEIKIGSKAGYYDSYARLSSTVKDQLKELRELNIAVVETEIEKKKMRNDINTGKRATVLLDANALMEYVNKVKSESQIGKIDATFTIEENEEK